MDFLTVNFQLAILFVAVIALTLRRFLSASKRSVTMGLNNIPGPPSPSWFKGNFQQVFNPDAWVFHENLAKKYGSSARLHGPYGAQTLYTCDSKAMHTILVRDQDMFEEDDGFIEGNLIIFGDGLISTLGHRHRKQRKMLQPVFSAAHMKEMIPAFHEVSEKLKDALTKRLHNHSPIQEVDILSWMGRTALELMGQAGLGYSFDPLTDEDSAHPYSKVIKELLRVPSTPMKDDPQLTQNDFSPTMTRLQFWQFNVLPYISWIGTPSYRRLIVNLLPWRDLHHLRDMVDYMYHVAQTIYEGKKRALEMGDEAVVLQVGGGKDVVSVLMKENMRASAQDRLEDTEVISQLRNYCSTLIFAAMDTTSSAMAHLLHLLAQHCDVQEKLRQELMEAKRQNDGRNFSYEELNSLSYLDAVCRETLRLHSPASIVTRRACQDTVVPLHQSVTGIDGTEMHEVVVPKNASVIVSIYNANRNPDLWGEDAHEWKPERWLSPLPKALVEARIPGVYSHLMTFIGGSRSCIGFKFSQLEMKVVISTLIEHFRFSPSGRDSEIYWQMNGVTAPVVGKDTHPQLPMNISLVN
ncbi:cytochrome P450 [Lentinula raphanica]|nr:cytochrome P450 [Lentinula raphanica]